MLNDSDFRSLPGRIMRGRDGDKIGEVDGLYADRENGQPTFATVQTGLFGSSTNFVPLHEATVEGDQVVVPYTKDMVKDAPKVDPDAELTPDEEDTIYRHYGMTAGVGATDGTYGTTTDTATTGADTAVGGYTGTEQSAGTVGRDVSGPTTDNAMTRSEEELRVGTEQREAGRARLRKYVVTENVQQTVPVSREEIRVEREPITDANMGAATSGPELSEEEHEVTLHEERPVVDKEVVPRERVRLDTDTVTENVQVSETVAKEQIDTDGGVYPEEGRSATPAAEETRTQR